MRKILVAGRTACGKTTLCQRLAGLELRYHKTQSVQVVGDAIDIPGEYTENRRLLRGLSVTAADAGLVLLLHSVTDGECIFTAGQSAMFGCPVAGVVTKLDLSPGPERVRRAAALLRQAGAERVFPVSAVDGAGMGELVRFLADRGYRATRI